MSDDHGSEALSNDPVQKSRKPGSDPFPIRSVEFLGGMGSVRGWRPEPSLPEVAFAGRSNVGKSSLINTLIRRRSFVRVSRTPGRTREINFFSVNNLFVLADLPGYGYARISKSIRSEWKPLIEGYLLSSPKLRGVVQLVDIRHKPTNDDRQMLDFLAESGIPALVAATKVDKLSKKQAAEQLAVLAETLHLDVDQIIPFSSQDGTGRNDLASALLELVTQDVPDDLMNEDDTGVES